MRIADMTPTPCGAALGDITGNLHNRPIIAEVAVAPTPRAAVLPPLRAVKAIERARYHCPVGDAQFSCGAKLRIVAWDLRRSGSMEAFEALSMLGEELCYLGMVAIEDAKSPG